MTQRIFDIFNEKDYTDLWNIVPDDVNKIENVNLNCNCYIGNCIICTTLIKINWHGKTEITRPIQEATEADIGKICKFWNENEEEHRIAIFTSILDKFNYKYNFCDNTDTYWMHCRRLTKQEIEELI